MSQQPGGSRIRGLLFLGFGGLLLLLAFSGIDALSLLRRIETRSEQVRESYVRRDAILEQLRSNLYLSGTYARDLLLDPDPARGNTHRSEFLAARARIQSAIAQYGAILEPQERFAFNKFTLQANAYLTSLQPVLDWTPEQRRQRGFEFTQTVLLPRRLMLVQLADDISGENARQLEHGNLRMRDLFHGFRKALVYFLLLSLAGGLTLAALSVRRVLRLEEISARNYREIDEARTALRDLSARLVEVQESERRALSRELHDEVGQSLSAVVLGISNAAAAVESGSRDQARAQLHDVRRLTETTVAAVREMSLLLRPSMLDDLGLIPALEWQAREVSRNHPIVVEVEADSVSDDLPDEHKTCVYRVVQEALRNAVRHSNAHHVLVRLAQADHTLKLTVKDDGKGFRPERDKGIGLMGIEERVAHLAGRFELKSAPGSGSQLGVELPLPA